MVLTKKLYEEEAPDKIILSGGIANPKAGVSEAGSMLKYLVSKGMPEEVFVLEDKSKTTKQNALFSVPMAKELGATEILLCTSNEHMTRKHLNPIKIFTKQLKKQGMLDTVKLVPYSD